MNSATQILALKVWKLGFLKISLFSLMEPGHYCLAALCYLDNKRRRGGGFCPTIVHVDRGVYKFPHLSTRGGGGEN